MSREPASAASPEAMILDPRVLDGAFVRLEPVTDAHREEMRHVLDCDPESWWMVCAMGDHFPGYWEMLTGTPGRIAYAVLDKANGGIAGTSSFLAMEPQHRSVEIGYTWLHPDFRGTRTNPETKLLMLGHAFDSGARRIQFNVDARNLRSQRAVMKLGAKQEGVLRRHRVTWTGYVRDTAVFSIIDEEWPEVRERLRERLSR